MIWIQPEGLENRLTIGYLTVWNDGRGFWELFYPGWTKRRPSSKRCSDPDYRIVVIRIQYAAGIALRGNPDDISKDVAAWNADHRLAVSYALAPSGGTRPFTNA
jgi:hypothetical protein